MVLQECGDFCLEIVWLLRISEVKSQ